MAKMQMKSASQAVLDFDLADRIEETACDVADLANEMMCDARSIDALRVEIDAPSLDDLCFSLAHMITNARRMLDAIGPERDRLMIGKGNLTRSI